MIVQGPSEEISRTWTIIELVVSAGQSFNTKHMQGLLNQIFLWRGVLAESWQVFLTGTMCILARETIYGGAGIVFVVLYVNFQQCGYMRKFQNRYKKYMYSHSHCLSSFQ